MYFVCFRWRLSRLDPGGTNGRPIPRGRPPSLRAPCILREQRGHARPRSPAARRQRADARRGIAPDERQRCSSGQRRRPASRVPSSRAGSGQRPCVSRPPHAALAERPRPTDAPNGQVLFQSPRAKPTISRRWSAPNPQRKLRPHALTSPLKWGPQYRSHLLASHLAIRAVQPARDRRALGNRGDWCGRPWHQRQNPTRQSGGSRAHRGKEGTGAPRQADGQPVQARAHRHPRLHAALAMDGGHNAASLSNRPALGEQALRRKQHPHRRLRPHEPFHGLHIPDGQDRSRPGRHGLVCRGAQLRPHRCDRMALHDRRGL